MQAVALVLVLGAARARVDAVLGLEVLGEAVDVDRLDVAADGVLHLDAVARVLKGDPLNAVLVLPNDEGRGGRDGTGCGVLVDTAGALLVKPRSAWRAGLGLLLRAHSGSLSLELVRLHLGARAAGESGRDGMRGVLRRHLARLRWHEMVWIGPGWGATGC